MVTGSGLFLLGILTLVRFPSLPPAVLIGLLPLFMLAAVRLPTLRPPAWFACGFLWALLAAHLSLARGLEPDRQGEPLSVRGEVVSLPETGEHYRQFVFRVEEARDAQDHAVASPGRIRLNWYRPWPQLVPGQWLRLTVKLKRPHGYMNPGGFDYEGWLFQRGIRARGYVLAGNKTGRESAWSLHRWRYRLREKITGLAETVPRQPLILALALGDRSGMERSHWRVLNRTGTTHLLAISGLHIGLVAGLAFVLMYRLWPLSTRAALWLPTPHVAALAALTAATVYALLAGFTIPTQRALIMIATLLLARLALRRVPARAGFALALLAVLLFDPFAVLAPGFWLSFGAVALILFALASPLQRRGRTGRFARIQWYLFLGLAPLLAFWFQQVPLLSIIANSLAIPWVSLVSVPLILAGMLALAVSAPLAQGFLLLAGGSLSILWTGLGWLAQLEPGLWPLAPVTLPALLVALAGVIILLLPRATPGRWLGAIWLLPLLVPRTDVPEEGAFRFTLLDVGQGLAAVVQTRNHVLTYDTGPAYGSGFNTGWAVLLPYLRQAGISRIDTHVQSHEDNDHIGGLTDLLAEMPVARLLSSRPQAIDHPGATACRAGQSWQWDGIRFRILHPAAGSGLRGNDRSCVLRISTGRYSVLLPGDIERRGERVLLAGHAPALASSILVVPHHGSASSSSPAFVRAVAADYALFSVGYRNRYGFPKPDIMARYRASGAALFATPRSGALQFRVDREGIDVSRWREQSRRFWHNRP